MENFHNIENNIITSDPINTDMSIINLFLSSDLIGKSVIILLISLSIYSWAIIFNKLWVFSNIKIKIKNFENNFWSGQPLDELYNRIKRNTNNPLASIFISAMNELKKGDKQSSDSLLKIGVKDRISQAIILAKNKEMENLESNLHFLASLASYAPFIGLLGTVWGIMHSFQSIASSKNTSIAVVAPGIAEALLATAIGLLAAIPAVAFYNYLTNYCNYFYNRMDDYSGELYTILSRNIDEEKI